MQQKKCSLDLFIDFLIATQKQYSGAELSKVAPEELSHDAVSRWLAAADLSLDEFWLHARPLVNLQGGYLIIDDFLLDKPYSKIIPFVKAQYSGKHHRVVTGIAIVTLLWTDGEKIVPVDYRIYNPSNEGKTKNLLAREMLETAKNRGFSPQYVIFDSWYSSIENLKAVTQNGWKFIAWLKSNRLVSITQGTYIPVSDLDWTSTQVHSAWLKAYGFVKIAKIDLTAEDITIIATNDLSISDAEVLISHAECRWKIELFHRGVKQCCGIERCYSQKKQSQLNHILCAILAFLKLEVRRLLTGVSWYEQKCDITRSAVTAYLANA